MRSVIPINTIDNPLIMTGISFFIKTMLVLGVISFERVIGYPIISSYIFWGFSRRDNLPKQMLLIILICLVLSGLYGMNILIIFSILGLGQLVLSLGLFRNKKLLRIAAAAVIVIGGFWIAGMQPTFITMFYGLIQIGLLLASQLRLRWYRRAAW